MCRSQRKRRIREGRLRDILCVDHWLPCHPSATQKKHILASSLFSSTPLFFSFFQVLFSFSTWQRSLKLLSFPNQKLFPDSLPLSYNYSAGPCFSVLFSGLLFQHCLFCTRGDITASMGRRRPGSFSVGQRSGLLPLVHTYLTAMCTSAVLNLM